MAGRVGLISARVQTCLNESGFAEASGWAYAHTLISLKMHLKRHALSAHEEQALGTC